MPSNERSSFPILATIILGLFVIGCGGILIISNYGYTEITKNQEDNYLIGIWDSADNNGESLVFLPDNIGYVSNINDSQKSQFIWLKTNVIDKKVYYEFHILSGGSPQLLCVDKRMPSILYHNDSMYIKRG